MLDGCMYVKFVCMKCCARVSWWGVCWKIRQDISNYSLNDRQAIKKSHQPAPPIVLKVWCLYYYNRTIICITMPPLSFLPVPIGLNADIVYVLFFIFCIASSMVHGFQLFIDRQCLSINRKIKHHYHTSLALDPACILLQTISHKMTSKTPYLNH